MSSLAVISALGGAIASVIYLLAYCRAEPGFLKSVTKAASTALLALAALFAGAPIWLPLALAFGSLGDLLLSRERDGAFLAGLIAFATAHLGYVLLFLTAAQSDPRALLEGTEFCWGGLMLAFGAVMVRLLWPVAGGLRWPVMGYIGIILAMGVVALALPPESRALPLLAALCFIASDAILSAELFLLREEHPARKVTPFAVWSLYWTAQALFLSAFAFA